MLSPIEVMKKIVECDNGRDAKGYRALLHDDFHSFVHGKHQHDGPEAEVESISAWWRATSDVHLKILEITEAEGLVTLRYSLSGTHDGDFAGLRATDRTYHMENCTLMLVVDGKAKIARRFADTLGLMTQLGAVPGAE
jgi:hypothetical protein